MKVETWREVLFTLKNAFVLRGSLVMAVAGFAFCIGIGYMDALLPVFTIQALGWTNDAYSNVLAGASVAAALAAMGVAGWLVRRVGMVRIMSGLLPALPADPGDRGVDAGAMARGEHRHLDHRLVHDHLYTFLMVAYLAVSMILLEAGGGHAVHPGYMAIGNMGRPWCVAAGPGEGTVRLGGHVLRLRGLHATRVRRGALPCTCPRTRSRWTGWARASWQVPPGPGGVRGAATDDGLFARPGVPAMKVGRSVVGNAGSTEAPAMTGASWAGFSLRAGRIHSVPTFRATWNREILKWLVPGDDVTGGD